MSARINKIMLVMFETNLKIYVGIIKYLARVYNLFEWDTMI